MSLGVHVALSIKDLAKLRKLEDPDEIMEFISEDLEERYLENDKWSFESDKSWDGIHRCLTEDALSSKAKPSDLSYAVLGGAEIDAGDDFIARLVEPEQVLDTAIALEEVEQDWFEERYEGLADTDYEAPIGEDFDSMWESFEGLRAFYVKAGKAGRAVLFTAS